MTTLRTDRTFGVEFEGYGIEMYTLVRKLQDAGLSAIAASYSGSRYDLWQVKPDGSINGRYGFEVVSPVLRGAEGVEQVKTALRVVRENGGDANKSCGFHIHWGVSDWRIKKFRNFYKRWGKFEKGIDLLQPESRRDDNAYYTKSVYSSVVYDHTTRNIAGTVKHFWNAIDRCRSLNQLRSTVQGNGRYNKLNIQKFHRTGTIEIRHHSGTFKEDKVVGWIELTGSLIADTDNSKGLKAWTGSVDAKKVLDTLLGATVRVGGISSATRTFYKQRAKELQRRIDANQTEA